MARRPNARQRANAKRVDDRALATALPVDIEHAPRVPLAGFEAFYEITRSGQLYSIRAKRFIKRAFFNGVYLQFQCGGETHTMPIADAVAQSWAQATPRLFRVEVPATTLVVYARDANEAREVTAAAVRDEIVERRLVPESTVLTALPDVPVGWTDVVPYCAPELNPETHTVQTLLTGEAPTAPLAAPAEGLIARLRREERARYRR